MTAQPRGLRMTFIQPGDAELMPGLKCH